MEIGRTSRAWLAAAALTWLWPVGTGAQSGSSADQVVATVDVEITQREIDGSGAATWPLQTPTVFTLQKLRTADGRTRIVLAYRANTSAERTLAASHPLEGGRVEYDSATGAFAVYDQGGTRRNPRLSLDQPAGASIGTPGDWLDGLVLTAASAPARQRELEHTYGRAIGSAGRLTRHVRNRDDATEDVLIDPVWGVPVEATLTRQGAREGRVTFEYGPTPSGNLVRRAIRSERVIDAGGRRFVLTMQFSNVRAEGW